MKNSAPGLSGGAGGSVTTAVSITVTISLGAPPNEPGEGHIIGQCRGMPYRNYLDSVS